MAVNTIKNMINEKFDNEKIINFFFLSACILVILVNFAGEVVWRSKIISTGIIPPLPLQPYTKFMRVPGNIVKLVPESEGPMGADFSQVYFAAKASLHGESGYGGATTEAYKDPFGRISSYPPFAHWLYIPLTIFPYWIALLIHNFGNLLLFFLAAGWMLRKFGIERHWWKVYALYLLYYFYTPSGWTYFERGQFDLLTATAVLLLFSTVYIETNKPLALILTGLFSAIKYVSLPFIGSFSFFALIANPKRSRWLYILPPVIVGLTLLAFWPQIGRYVEVLSMYEAGKGREGITFLHIMPPFLAKTFQIGCMLAFSGLFWWFSDAKSRPELFKKVSLPFALAMLVQGLCFGSMSFEYRVVVIFGLIPGFILWMETSEAPTWLKMALATSLMVYMVVAFHTLDPYISVYPAYMTVGYFLVSLFWLGLAGYLIITDKKGTLSHEH